MKLLVADTSPLISLIVIDKLHVLFDIFQTVVLPVSVWDELVKHPGIQKYESGLTALQKCITPLKNPLHIPAVDKGEADAISLYMEMSADVLLIDDKKGRQFAEQNQVNCIGTLGLLIAAKDKNLVSDLRPLFINLLNQNRYYQKDLLSNLLIEKGESPI